MGGAAFGGGAEPGPSLAILIPSNCPEFTPAYFPELTASRQSSSVTEFSKRETVGCDAKM